MSEWTDIGEKLQKARESRDLSLQDVTHKLRIPTQTLKALEECDFAHFPSSTYARSFLHQYSDFLKVDAHDLLESIESDNIFIESENIQFLHEPLPSKPPRTSRKAEIPPKNNANFLQPILLLLVTGGIIAAGVWAYLVFEKRLNQEPKIIENSTSPPPQPSDSLASDSQAPDPQRPPRQISGSELVPVPSGPQSTNSQNPLVLILPESQNPPRAVIVNEDE